MHRQVESLNDSSGYINRFRNADPGIPTISIWGNENRPVVWRMASDAIESGFLEWVSIGHSEGQAVRRANTFASLYNARAILALAQPISWISIRIGFIRFKIPVPTGTYAYTQWRRGWRFLKHDAESDWSNLIGSVRTERRRSCRQRLVCDMLPSRIGSYPGAPVLTDDAIERRCDYQEVCTWINVPITEPSDGLIHRTSQQGGGTAWARNPDHRNREAVGANHLEQNNHREVQDILTRAFDGEEQRIFEGTR